MDKIKEVVVVEGKHDEALLKSIYDVRCILTNGSHLGKNVLDMIGKYVNDPGVIVFTDPDSVGENIRKRIMDVYPTVKHVYIDKSKAKTLRKVGVEHANFEDIRKAFANVASYDTTYQSELTMADLIDLGLAGSKESANLRNILKNKVPIGQCNAKTCLHRLQYLKLDKGKIEEILYGKNSNL